MGSKSPIGFTPLNSLRARPSQKLRKLKAAPIVVGVLRGSTSRKAVCEKTPGEGPASTKLSGLPIVSATFPGTIFPNECPLTPIDEAMSLVSNCTAELGSLGLASLKNGKAAPVNW